MPTDLLVSIDVPDLGRAVAFSSEAFGLTVTGRFGVESAELSGWPVRLYLLQKVEGSTGARESLRRYDRHWTRFTSTSWWTILRRRCPAL